MNDKIILNGSGQGLRRFELVNGKRHWLDMPSNEWQKQASIDQKHNNKHNNKNQNETNQQSPKGNNL